ncbi:hypothetical protein FACS1894187_05300 [Synergistales bacterium]|nr:hypothetical protein FACS1894187_05300 [Synergistales bacterium]
MINLKVVLDAHLKWLRDEEGGEKADLRVANLRGANLRGANLSEANLREADLSEADLSEAILYRADLREAILYRADLREADLYRADLYRADLRGANLRGADLREADLSGADLSEANGIDNLISVGLIGSAKRQTLYDMKNDIVFCGCFKGTLEELRAKNAGRDNKIYEAEYVAAIEFFERIKEIWRGEG